jgi:hypothetical protein
VLLFGITHRSVSHEYVPKYVLGLENSPAVLAVPNPLEVIRDALLIGDGH